MPPTTLRADLSKEDVERVNGLRRQMWTRGAQGFGLGGLLGGYGCWSLMRLQHNYPSHSVARVLPKITGKHVLMWALLDAVTLSYFAVTYEGMKGAAAVRTKFEQGQRDATQASSPFDASKDLQVRLPLPSISRPSSHGKDLVVQRLYSFRKQRTSNRRVTSLLKPGVDKPVHRSFSSVLKIQ